MTDSYGVNIPDIHRVDEVAEIAAKILKVYGKSGDSTLTREIMRMSEALGIPLEEMFKDG